MIRFALMHFLLLKSFFWSNVGLKNCFGVHSCNLTTSIFYDSLNSDMWIWLKFGVVFRRRVVVYKGGFVGLSVCLSVCRSVGRLVCLQNILKNSKSRFGDYIALVCTLINTLLIVVLGMAGGRTVGRLAGQSVGWSVFKIFWKTQNWGLEII